MARKGKDGDDYKVGYGRPPERTRFKPGKSGNPKGRPKGRKALSTVLEEELEKHISITENGVTKRVKKGVAIIKQLVSGGLKGQLPATKLISSISSVGSEDRPISEQQLSAADQKLLQDFFRPRKGRRK